MKLITKRCDKCSEQEQISLEFEQQQDPNYIREIKIPGVQRGKGIRMDLCPQHHRALTERVLLWLTGVATLDQFYKNKVTGTVIPESETEGPLADDGQTQM